MCVSISFEILLIFINIQFWYEIWIENGKIFRFKVKVNLKMRRVQSRKGTIVNSWCLSKSFTFCLSFLIIGFEQCRTSTPLLRFYKELQYRRVRDLYSPFLETEIVNIIGYIIFCPFLKTNVMLKLMKAELVTCMFFPHIFTQLC